MPYYRDPSGNEYGITLEDLIVASKLLFKGSEPHINYDIDFLRETYSKDEPWLTIETHSGVVVAPYLIIYDYRKNNASPPWGKIIIKPQYMFPAELSIHKKNMEEKFTKEGKLKKGNRPCPRIADIILTPNNQPEIIVHKAWYYDQVGTNLTPDLPFTSQVIEDGQKYRSVREWDIHNSNETNKVPSFSSSRLANTIGVAIGITAKDEKGELQVLRRKRSQKVAVYEGQWHLPFSFALAWDEQLKDGDQLGIDKLILPDYGYEFAEELNKFEITDFEPAKPIALCRDMVRAGKPQFFFEIRSRIPLKKLIKDMKPDGYEYVGKARISQKKIEPSYSPELVAFTMLLHAFNSE